MDGLEPRRSYISSKLEEVAEDDTGSVLVQPIDGKEGETASKFDNTMINPERRPPQTTSFTS